MTRRDVELLTDSQDIEAAADHLGLPRDQAASITAMAVIVADGDYSHAWATESSRPFDRQALFEPLLVEGRRIDPDKRIAITVDQIEAGGDGGGRDSAEARLESRSQDPRHKRMKGRSRRGSGLEIG